MHELNRGPIKPLSWDVVSQCIFFENIFSLIRTCLMVIALKQPLKAETLSGNTLSPEQAQCLAQAVGPQIS